MQSDGEVNNSSFKQDLDKAKKFIYDQGFIQSFVPPVEGIKSIEFDQFVEQKYDSFRVENSPLKGKKIIKTQSKSPVQTRQAAAE